MFWSTGLILVLAVSQVPAEFVTPDYIENVIENKSGGNSRIVSGWLAYPGQHPHQTSLRMVNAQGGVSGCGGSVVAREWVLTAAHCTAGQIAIVVRAGVTSLTTPQYIFETAQWYNHPTYNDNNPGLVQPNDIAALKLQRPVSYTRLLQPIRLQTSAEAYANYDNEVVIASGFGRTWTNSATPEDLNWVYLRAISNVACQQVFGSALITESAVCARWYNVTSQSTCQGDSGGPLVHVDKDGVPVLIGIASFVAGGDFGCHSGIPAGFIRTGPFLPWLKQVTGIDFENLNEEDEVVTTPQPEESTTQAPLSTEPAPPSTTQAPETTQTEAVTTVAPQTTQPDVSTTTTTVRPPSTPEPEDSDEDDSSDSSESESEEDPEVSELLKKLIVKVKVKVKVNNTLKKKVKVKCVDNLKSEKNN